MGTLLGQLAEKVEYETLLRSAYVVCPTFSSSVTFYFDEKTSRNNPLSFLNISKAIFHLPMSAA